MHRRLKNNPKPWTNEHTKIVKQTKNQIKILPCLHIADLNVYKIVGVEAVKIKYGGILKQKKNNIE